MIRPIVKDPENIKLGIIGMTEGNGHPYSWSAIINGKFNREKMTDECPYAGIPQYLNREPVESYDINHANVTHIYCNDKKDAEHVAACSGIANVVDSPEDMIGQVDAVIIATDQPQEHVERARPFIKADVPLFIDKPLCSTIEDLKTFRKWIYDDKKVIMSSSGMRFAKEYAPWRQSTGELGKLNYISITMCKYWETYGIHALESFYPILGPGFLSIQNLGTDKNKNIVHITHKNNIDIIVSCGVDLSMGTLVLSGTEGHVEISFKDTFTCFKTQMESFIDFLRTGEYPYPFSETEELMKLIIGGIISREENNRKIYLEELNCE